MPEIFPHTCVRCGMCCLVETCLIGQTFFDINKLDPCPALRFEEDGSASCDLYVHEGLPATELGIGVGCCIAARVRTRDGKLLDFASLPMLLKRMLARRMRREGRRDETGKPIQLANVG